MSRHDNPSPLLLVVATIGMLLLLYRIISGTSPGDPVVWPLPAEAEDH